MTRRTARPGLTLTEALVSLFVMALGLLSLLTLFPLGAFQIGQALKDDRCAQTAVQADGFLRAYWQTNVIDGTAENGNILQAALNPGTIGPITAATMPVLNPGTQADEPSYPVFVDPLGWAARGAIPAEQAWLARSNATAAAATTIVPRRNLAVAVDPLRTCCLADDLAFGENGAPGATVDWQARYNWSAVVQLPRLGNRTVANLTVLVFDGRPPLQGATQTELLVTTAGTVTPGTTTSVTITLPGGFDGTTNYVRKGGWIMDGTIAGTTRLANFYRIAGVTPGAPGTFTLDLETPIKPQWNGVSTPYTPQLYVFAGLAEVFERPQLRPTSYTTE